MDVRFLEYQWNYADPVYCSRAYLQSLNGGYGWLAGYIGDELRLVIPYTVKTKLIFKIATFQSAPIAISNIVTEEEERAFLNDCVRMLAKIGVDFCSQSPTHVVFRVCPDNAISAPFGSYIVNLEPSEEELWSGVHAKHRNVILNAIKKGVEIRFGLDQNIRCIHDIMVETMSRSKMSFISFAAFAEMISALGKNIEVAVAYHDGIPIGCGIFPFSKYCAYYQYGGSVGKTPLGAMNLLHWQAMKYFKSRDVNFYDFVGARVQPKAGSKLEGIQRFKQRFGATMKVGYLWKIPITYRYHIYNAVHKVKNRGMKDIIDQELYGN
jgi:lipid II:glycine glycyltransferase (peptidoglycan interpeptide bridge formation enzyme)